MKNAESSAFKVLVEAIRENWFQVCTIYPGFGGGGYVLMVPIMQEKKIPISVSIKFLRDCGDIRKSTLMQKS